MLYSCKVQHIVKGARSRWIQWTILDKYNRASKFNNVSFWKGHMSDKFSTLVGQNRNVVGRLF